MTRNTYLVCRMFWSNDSVHSNVCWGTLNPQYQFNQVTIHIPFPCIANTNGQACIVVIADSGTRHSVMQVVIELEVQLSDLLFIPLSWVQLFRLGAGNRFF